MSVRAPGLWLSRLSVVLGFGGRACPRLKWMAASDCPRPLGSIPLPYLFHVCYRIAASCAEHCASAFVLSPCRWRCFRFWSRSAAGSLMCAHQASSQLASCDVQSYPRDLGPAKQGLTPNCEALSADHSLNCTLASESLCCRGGLHTFR
jgi:hypothetical protein